MKYSYEYVRDNNLSTKELKEIAKQLNIKVKGTKQDIKDIICNYIYQSNYMDGLKRRYEAK